VKQLVPRILIMMLVVGLSVLTTDVLADRQVTPASDDAFGAVVDLSDEAGQAGQTPEAPFAEPIDPADIQSTSDQVLHLPPVPLPSGALAGMGLIGVMMLYRRRRRSLFRG
jgi:hypothetical protein